MELVFTRHGQGEHTLDVPKSLQITDPALTEEGLIQAKSLKEQFPLSKSDVIIASPTRRTIQTAQIWSEDIKCKKIVSPFISPRMFPQKSEWQTLPCDKILSKQIIKEEFSDFYIEEELSNKWWVEGINKLPDEKFNVLAGEFLNWSKQFGNKRIYLVSHDGTIMAYSQIILGKELTRNDFPKETGYRILNC
ncbi:MAG: histidine phosphatase family protein [Halobacillus sp.]|uniref:histidine phosphatase family protein n=1 Tax=Halobacillus sp. TaxID=56800 RepID=UPI003BAF0153